MTIMWAISILLMGFSGDSQPFVAVNGHEKMFILSYSRIGWAEFAGHDGDVNYELEIVSVMAARGY
jgi:hypothetical protein